MTVAYLTRRRVVLACLFGSLVACLPHTAGAKADGRKEHWVATWAAAPQGLRFAMPRPAPSPAQPGQSNPPSPPPAPPPAIANQTLRMIVHTSIPGRRACLQLSNAFGTTALEVGAAHIAVRDKGSAIVPGSDRPLTFGGNSSFWIPAGADALSDPVDIEVPRLGDLVISLFIPGTAATPTVHLTALHTTYISQPGDFTGASSFADARTVQMWYWISAVDVEAPSDAGLIVAFGDSVTDGATSTPDTDRSWPAQLAERLAANKATADVAIVNEGITANRLLNDGGGASALARFDRDVLAQPGVKWLILFEGGNDIGFGARPDAQPPDAVTADDVIAAQKQLIDRAHVHGIKVIGATLTPFLGSFLSSDQGETIREAVNQWIRTSGAYDAVIDFDAVVRDPANPKQIRPSFNIRDHLHPNDDGYKAMADSVDLSLFTPKKK
jgi:lysophospholipase L1-like esterase